MSPEHFFEKKKFREILRYDILHGTPKVIAQWAEERDAKRVAVAEAQAAAAKRAKARKKAARKVARKKRKEAAQAKKRAAKKSRQEKGKDGVVVGGKGDSKCSVEKAVNEEANVVVKNVNDAGSRTETTARTNAENKAGNNGSHTLIQGENEAEDQKTHKKGLRFSIPDEEELKEVLKGEEGKASTKSSMKSSIKPSMKSSLMKSSMKTTSMKTESSKGNTTTHKNPTTKSPSSTTKSPSFPPLTDPFKKKFEKREKVPLSPSALSLLEGLLQKKASLSPKWAHY
jgi:hypothetical protein